MDSGEGKPRWVHYANSSIVQEDYKGTSPSSSKLPSEESPGDGVKLYDLAGDTKWWLHHQPKENPTSFWEPSWETMEMEEKYAKIKEFEAEKKSQDELSKAELLEALCHSQTRAREAEKAAQKANNEKEDMISQFMKQASQLFAYKQWFRILQLEATRNSKYHQQRVWKRKKKEKADSGSSRYKNGKSFGSFVLGLSLGGAGFLLGWTLGWLFR
ncbi:uncharacterized protein LOC111876132 [Lactuca sativa]|uniref:uncharacterized protein LOC111876132 n=1 Tax=Lactuca sativa TaxID=4236 RepID=UPI000CBFBD44|nr:uncharacterized protein LOC111876132 [Lactuca sativa]